MKSEAEIFQELEALKKRLKDFNFILNAKGEKFFIKTKRKEERFNTISEIHWYLNGLEDSDLKYRKD